MTDLLFPRDAGPNKNRRTRPLFLGWCSGLAVALFASTLAAQGSDQAIAEALFRDGRKLIDDGKLAEGCAKLEQSQRADPKLGTLLNVAVCHEKLGRTATAWAEFLDAETQANRVKQNDRAQFARAGAQRLEGKLSRLTLRAQGPTSDLVIVLDGKPFSAGMLGTSLPVDPGEHRLEVSASGKQPFLRTLSVAAGPSEVTVDIPALEPAASAPAEPEKTPAPPATAASAAPSTPAPTNTPTPASAPRSEQEVGRVPTWAWISLGMGAAGIVTGSITGGIAMSKESSLSTACPNNTCPKSKESNLSSARTMADISTVAFVIGGIATAAGLVGVFSAGGSENQELSFSIEPKRVGVAGRF
ncbi:MAG TPA: hypothetical protein VGP93_05270 [Polyangiaceae bacterium]|jgi:hypothetical protein|nr:hypothetical protein [Polyangiaceae bacterium]